MKISISKAFSFKALILFLFGSSAIAQITSTRSSSDTSTQDVASAQNAVNKVLVDSGMLFKEGLLAYEDKKMSDAGEKFNKSVEVFLYSTLNIQRDPKLQGCYNQLIETVYRIEFPSDSQLPQVRSLAQTCGWANIDATQADKITAIARSSIVRQTASATTVNTVAVNTTSAPSTSQVGFNTQEFEPSPLDDLSRLELTQDEQQIDNNPVAQQQYQYIQYAVANKSLGFSFQVHPMIQQYINYYRGRGRTTMEIGLYRSGMFMSMARRIFREEGIPENVAWLAQVESTWKPTALSWAAASGLWQFIPGTGARFGLQSN